MLKSRFFYTVFVTCIIGSVWQLLYRHSLDIPSDDFALLASLDQKKYESIILALEPYKGTMLAANFLGDVELYSVEESYFPRKEYRSYEVNAKNPLLTTQDSRFALAAIESTKLSDRLVLVSEARAPDNVFYFSSRARSKQAMKLASKGMVSRP